MKTARLHLHALVAMLMLSLITAVPARLVRAEDADAREDEEREAVESRDARGFEPEWMEHMRETAELRARFSREPHRRPSPVSRERIQGILAAVPNLPVNDKSGDGFGSAQVEPSIATFGMLSACAFNTDKMPLGGDGISAACQSAPGAMWWPTPLPPPAPMFGPMSKWIADPVLSVNQKTSMWFFSGLFKPTAGFPGNGIALVKGMFMPGGPGGMTLTWGPSSVVRVDPTGTLIFDKEWIAADSSSGNLYMCYTSFGSGTDSILFQSSSDAGMTWSSPLTIAAATPALLQGSRVAVGPSGEVYVTWFRAAGPPDSMLIRKSTDHGVTFGPRVTVGVPYSNFGSGAPGSNLLDAPNFPAIAVDRSLGTHRGRVYVAWAEAENYGDDAMGTGGAMVELAPSGSIFHATSFTPGMVLRGTLAGVDADTWMFMADPGKTYSFLVDSIPPGIVSLTVTCPDSTVPYVQSVIPTGIASGKPNLSLFTPNVGGMYFVKLVHSSTSVLGYRMKTGVAMPGAADIPHGFDQRDARVAWSDGGSVWSGASMVHGAPGSDQVMPEIGVSIEGYVYASWLDYGMGGAVMCDPVSNVGSARSTDGGTTWSPAFPVTSTSTAWWSTPSDIVPNQGDYLGLAAGEQVVYAYPDGRLGDPDIFASNLFLGMSVGCVPDSAWHAGTDHTLTYSIFNANGLFPNDYKYTLTPERSWPGFPITGTVTVAPASSSGAIPISFTVPDSAAHGMMGMTFKVELPNGALSSTCTSTDTITGATTAVGPTDAAPRLALSRAWPNPARGAFRVTFSLPNGSPARLELIDLAGRRVLERAVSGPGPHVVALEPDSRSVPVGIYALRLTQGGQAVSTKLALVR